MAATVSFSDFYEAVHDHGPFPWQKDLASLVLESGVFPRVLDIPTGLGKTSVIDIGVWLAARTGCRPGTAGRRRTFFVIDRRIVVDDAFSHARQIAKSLEGDREACVDVARALRGLAGLDDSASPLVIARMRGGVSWDWRWLDRPDRAAVVVGTVDQLGSRFLFRGYGLSPALAPIDAALVGTDSLIIVDEAHLCRPL
ncbi:MAG: type I-G CRISPR-associated helicase/endonuclease Cas3g, partial [Acidimicrobiales bacterium]